jgi:hypothetical protein
MTNTYNGVAERPELTVEDEKRLMFLDALEEGGVDNWDWYDEACIRYREMLSAAGMEDDE